MEPTQPVAKFIKHKWYFNHKAEKSQQAVSTLFRSMTLDNFLKISNFFMKHLFKFYYWQHIISHLFIFAFSEV